MNNGGWFFFAVMAFTLFCMLLGTYAHAATGRVPATATFIDVSKKCPPETHRWLCDRVTGKCKCKEK